MLLNNSPGQLAFEHESTATAEREFQSAVRVFYSAKNESEYAAASKIIESTRSILILDFGFTLEQICDLVDRA